MRSRGPCLGPGEGEVRAALRGAAVPLTSWPFPLQCTDCSLQPSGGAVSWGADKSPSGTGTPRRAGAAPGVSQMCSQPTRCQPPASTTTAHRIHRETESRESPVTGSGARALVRVQLGPTQPLLTPEAGYPPSPAPQPSRERPQHPRRLLRQLRAVRPTRCSRLIVFKIHLMACGT